MIPAVSTYAVAVPGGPGRPATVQVHDGNGDQVIATVTPFPGFEGTPRSRWPMSTATWSSTSWPARARGRSPEVVAYDGDGTADGSFSTELTRFAPFDAGLHAAG